MSEKILRKRYHPLIRRHLEEAFGTGLKRHTVRRVRDLGERVVAHVTVHLSRDDNEHFFEVWMNEHGDLITLVEREAKENLLRE